MGANPTQRIFNFNRDEIIVDLFAGGGGASTGIESALGGISPDLAINHNTEALALHRANHPNTRHLKTDVFEVDPTIACNGAPVGLLWFSPDCTHHSKAKSGKPVKKIVRSLAWVGVLWAALVKPRVMILENVEEFKNWGPLDENERPDKERKGQTFDLFTKALSTGIPEDHPDIEELQKYLRLDNFESSSESCSDASCPMEGRKAPEWIKDKIDVSSILKGLGYKVEFKILSACDYGAPTIRKRLFMIARRDGEPIIWPQPTHGEPQSETVKNGDLLPWKTAADCIDWDIPTPSIFDTAEEIKSKLGINVRRPLKDNTLRRVAKGLKKYVLENPKPFIVKNMNNNVPTSIDKPASTILTGNHHYLTVPFLTEHANGSSQRNFGINEPVRTICAQVKGGHFALVSAFVAQHNLGAIGRKADAPLATITTTGTQQQIVAAHIQREFGQSIGHAVTEPSGTITAGGGGKSSLVQAFLLKYYGTGGDQMMKEPMHTITTKDRFGLVMVHGEKYQIVDIGMRMLTPRELYRAQGFPDNYKIDIEFNEKKLSKTAQVRMCGNSVCPPLAEALVRANYKVKMFEKSAA